MFIESYTLNYGKILIVNIININKKQVLTKHRIVHLRVIAHHLKTVMMRL